MHHSVECARRDHWRSAWSGVEIFTSWVKTLQQRRNLDQTSFHLLSYTLHIPHHCFFTEKYPSILSPSFWPDTTLNKLPLASNTLAWVAQSVERVTLTISVHLQGRGPQDHLKVAGSSPASGSIPESLAGECSINILKFWLWWRRRRGLVVTSGVRVEFCG